MVTSTERYARCCSTYTNAKKASKLGDQSSNIGSDWLQAKNRQADRLMDEGTTSPHYAASQTELFVVQVPLIPIYTMLILIFQIITILQSKREAKL